MKLFEVATASALAWPVQAALLRPSAR